MIRDQLAEIFIGEFLKDPELQQAITLTPEIMASYAGLYYEPVTGQTKQLELRNGDLYDGNNKLTPTSPSIFLNPATTADYIFETQQGNAKEFSLDAWQYTKKSYQQTSSWAPDIEELQTLTGTYSSADSNTTYIVKMINNQLVIEQEPGRIQVLTPLYKDAFEGNFGVPEFDIHWTSERFSSNGVIRFERDSRNVVTELSGSWGRVFDMRFKRQSN